MANLGQLIITGVSGTALTEEEKKFIENENIGGVILFKQNYESPAQLAELVNSIQVLREEYPLFISVDQEGGRVFRFKEGFTPMPAMMDLAALDSPKTCFQVSKIMAEELSACGINLNFSPCCDVLSHPDNTAIGDRAFGKTGDDVSKFISSIIRGLQTSAVMACAKHFPGHGPTGKDSHHGLPFIKKSFQELQSDDLIPFVKAVKSRVEFVMMGHLVYDCIDPELPCSLSPKAHELLRKDLKFTRLIISDDMQMGAIVERYSAEQAAVMAISAGSDIILYRDMDQARVALEALKKAHKDRKIKPEEITQKYRLIQETKKNNLKEYKPVYIPEISKSLKTTFSLNFMKEVQEQIEEKKSQN